MNQSRKIRIDPLEAEIDAIRVRLYEKTKNMTADEEAEYFNSHAREILKKQGINAKFVKAPGKDTSAPQP